MPLKSTKNQLPRMLPMTLAEMRERGWDQADVILVTGDAYVDHPSFGVALIGRWLESLGWRVAVLAQPDWRSAEEFRSLGPPRLFWGITSGCVDSRLNSYASMGHKRHEDVFSPGGRTDLRPEKPLLAYAARAREAFKGVPVVLGGLEASLRRLVHYDYIEDRLKRSILTDAKADVLVHGMGELAIAEIASRLDAGRPLAELADIPGTAHRLVGGVVAAADAVELPGLEQQHSDAEQVMAAQLAYQRQAHPAGVPIVQDQGAGKILVNPPARPLSSEEMDRLYSLSYSRRWHSRYDKDGGIAALEPVRFSITTHRGCFGGCSFCSIYFHQGKTISSRSVESLLSEAQTLVGHPDFRGTIQDIGGPSANMYGMSCGRKSACEKPSCLHPTRCKHLKADVGALMSMMRAFRKFRSATPKCRNVFVSSGIRHDLAVESVEYVELLAEDFVSGNLKIAPEHYCPGVLELMGKPRFEVFERFEEMFEKASRKAGKKQYLVPYFISAHPGCTAENAIELTEYMVGRGLELRQVQDFTPVPLTLATAMFVAGRDWRGRRIHIARGQGEKQLQAALMQYYNPRHRRVLTNFLSSGNRAKLLKRLIAIWNAAGPTATRRNKR